MEIEFQNDYTVIPCVYTTPAFYMDNIGPPLVGVRGAFLVYAHIWCVPLGKPFPQVNDDNNISFKMNPNVPYSIFSQILQRVSGEITFFNYVDA